MAAARAKQGCLSTWKDAEVGLQAPLSPEGISMMSELASQLDHEDFVNSGIYEDGEEYLVSIPTRIVENPVKTVGLGDTISGLSFVGE
jgi:ADP-dependent phosphofructokinase/glucokinase